MDEANINVFTALDRLRRDMVRILSDMPTSDQTAALAAQLEELERRQKLLRMHLGELNHFLEEQGHGLEGLIELLGRADDGELRANLLVGLLRPFFERLERSADALSAMLL